MRPNRALLVMLAVTGLCLPSAANAVTLQICVKIPNNYLDSGIGEDFWTTVAAQPAVGANVALEKNNGGFWVPIWSGAAGDGIGFGDPGLGCLTYVTTTPNGSYRISVQSTGVVDGHTVQAWDGTASDTNEATWVTYQLTGTFGITDNGAGVTYNVTAVMPSTNNVDEVFDAYMATAWAVHRAPGIVTPAGRLFKVVLSNAKSGYDGFGTDYVFLANAEPPNENLSWAFRKFLTIHEVGHRFSELALGDEMNGEQDYTLFDPLCPSEVPVNAQGDTNGDRYEDTQPPDRHGMRSQEWVGAAIGEGFADFFAAHAWNNTATDDCKFGNWVSACIGAGGAPPCSATVDCESGDQIYPVRQMWSRPCTTTLGGAHVSRGNEVDWMRAYWDLETNSHAQGTPQLIDIIEWLRDASGATWTETTGFTVLDGTAQWQAPNFVDLWNSTREHWQWDPACNGDCNGLEPN